MGLIANHRYPAPTAVQPTSLRDANQPATIVWDGKNMKIAKATKKDMTTIVHLAGILEDIGRGYYPRKANGDQPEEEQTFFDPDDAKHLRTFYDRVSACLETSPGGLFRVVGGFHTLMHNDIVDPAKDYLDFHPRFKPVADAVVVCLCGSTRFRDQFTEINRRETMKGNIVLAPGVFAHSGDQLTEEDKTRLDELHLRKIDMAGKVVVINPEGYIGESTRREIAYAEKIGKPIEYTDVLHSLGCEG